MVDFNKLRQRDIAWKRIVQEMKCGCDSTSSGTCIKASPDKRYDNELYGFDYCPCTCHQKAKE